MRKPFARLSRRSLYWQAYCALAGPSCDGCELIVRQQNFCTRIRQQKYTSRQPKSDRKVYQCLLWRKPGGCHTAGTGLALCLATRPCQYKVKPLRGTCAHTPTCMGLSCCKRGEPQSFGEGERGQGALCHIAQGRNVSIAKGRDSRVVREKAPLFPWARFRNSNLCLSATHGNPPCNAT